MPPTRKFHTTIENPAFIPSSYLLKVSEIGKLEEGMISVQS